MGLGWAPTHRVGLGGGVDPGSGFGVVYAPASSLFHGVTPQKPTDAARENRSAFGMPCGHCTARIFLVGPFACTLGNQGNSPFSFRVDGRAFGHLWLSLVVFGRGDRLWVSRPVVLIFRTFCRLQTAPAWFNQPCGFSRYRLCQSLCCVVNRVGFKKLTVEGLLRSGLALAM